MTTSMKASRRDQLPRSRRALLAGALAGVGAWAASTLAKPGSTRAGVDGDVVLGATSDADAAVTKVISWDDAFIGESRDFGYGLQGISAAGTGVYGNGSEQGVLGTSPDSVGVLGTSLNSIGVKGFGGNDGVQGSGKDRGVAGFSRSGHAIEGQSARGWAGWFEGKVHASRYLESAR